MKIAWRLEKLKSKFTGKKPLLTKQSARVAQSKTFFDNTKLLNTLPDFSFTPLSQTIEKACNRYKQQIPLILKPDTMKKILPFLILLLTQMASMAQEKNFSILGKVVDSATQQVLQGASAYCQNTTQGTITNKEGLFFLRLPNGGYDLVISFMGYEKKVIRISNNLPAVDTMHIALLKEEKSLAEVAVVASTELADGLARYGQFFIDHFIGTSPNASQCVIKNPEALKFYFFKKRNRLKVTAREDLIITNAALGIQYPLPAGFLQLRLQ